MTDFYYYTTNGNVIYDTCTELLLLPSVHIVYTIKHT